MPLANFNSTRVKNIHCGLFGRLVSPERDRYIESHWATAQWLDFLVCFYFTESIVANPEHVEIVKHGKDAIAAWRKQDSWIRLDLRGASLSEADLAHTNLHRANLNKPQLIHANLHGASLDEAILNVPLLAGTDLTEVNLSRHF